MIQLTAQLFIRKDLLTDVHISNFISDELFTTDFVIRIRNKQSLNIEMKNGLNIKSNKHVLQIRESNF